MNLVLLSWRHARRRLEALMVYAPVVLMGLLALASYWLLRATPEVAGSPAPRAAR